MLFKEKTPIETLLAALVAVFLAASCGAPGSMSTGFYPNDTAPSGTIVTQATLQGVNGKTASGSVVIYRQTTTQFVLRLSAVTLPSETGLRIVPTVDSVEQSSISLRSTSGSQNYTLTFASPPAYFNSVVIRNASATDYAQALF